MSVCCECCVSSGRGLCVGLTTRQVGSYRVWWVWLWTLSFDNEKVLAHQVMLRQGEKYLHSFVTLFGSGALLSTWTIASNFRMPVLYLGGHRFEFASVVLLRHADRVFWQYIRSKNDRLHPLLPPCCAIYPSVSLDGNGQIQQNRPVRSTSFKFT